MNVYFVIISYDCNFWAMAALESLLESLAEAGLERQVWIVHNFKSTRQIDHFQSYVRCPLGPGVVQHLTAYEGVFEQVINYADHERAQVHRLAACHGMALNWLIKYRLPERPYLFIDHDCFVRPGFVRALEGVAAECEGKAFVFPRHTGYNKSLTAPMFYCDIKAARPLIAGLCDIGWAGCIVRHGRGLLQGGGERYYTNSDFERQIYRPNFDDTLHNVVRYLLAQNPELVERLALVSWPEHDHIWHAATHPLEEEQTTMLLSWMAGRFRPEHFEADIKVSDLLHDLLVQLDESGIGNEFRKRFLKTKANEIGTPKR